LTAYFTHDDIDCGYKWEIEVELAEDEEDEKI
jgi:hypothetical protein